MKRAALASAILMTTACSQPISTDGTAEATLVAKWLQDGGSGKQLLPGARLVMSDYEVPLTRANLARMGPDRHEGCRASIVKRSGAQVLALWECKQSLPEIQRQVWFDVSADHIRAAKYTEADIWSITPER